MIPVVIIIIVVAVWFVNDVVFDVVEELKVTEYKSRVPLTQLVNEVIHFTGGILHKNGIKHYPTFELRYYRHKKWGGIHIDSGHIIIYTKSHSNIEEVISTTLHEVSHYISMKLGRPEYVNYNQILKDVGYENHKEEISARSFSHTNLKPCLNYLLEKKIIEKV